MKAETKTELMEGWSSKGVHEELLLERLEVKGWMRLQITGLDMTGVG